MRRLIVASISIWLLASGGAARAQQYYSFEEACKKGGWTTGPCAPKTGQPQAARCIPIIGSAFHAEKMPGTNSCVDATLSPVGDAEIFIEMIGLRNVSKINDLKITIMRSSRHGGAVALFRDGGRLIIYDPEWAKSATAESYLVLGHEAGHHFCGHTIGDLRANPKDAELEADRFAGASIKRFELYHDREFLDAALTAARRLYSEKGSQSHPSRDARIEAIRDGYDSGSPCGNLEPGIRGYSPTPR